MKNIFYVIILFVLSMMLFGCMQKNTADIADISDDFICNAEIKYKDITASAKITRAQTRIYEIELTSPSHLKDFKLSYDNGTVNVSYKGFKINLGEENKSLESIPKILADTMDSLVSGVEFNTNEKEGDVTIQGNNSNYDYNAVVDIKNMQLKSLEIPSQELKCDFYDFK